MTLPLMPSPKIQFFGVTGTYSGKPLAGGKLYTYVAGTTTPKATYSDSQGATPNANPVVLDSQGMASVWLSGYYDVALYDSGGLLQYTQGNISSSASLPATTVSEWVLQTLNVLTYVGATQFSIQGDLRTTFPNMIRVKASVTAGTIYGTVTGSSYATGSTTITVQWDSGSLDSGLSAVSTGLLAPTNVSIPPVAFLPPGIMLPYGGATAPVGWLLCYGQAVSRSTYSALFLVVGTSFGAGDGSTTFNLPDLRGRSLIGLDNLGGSAANRVAAATSVGQSAGAEKVDVSHTHTTGDVTLTAAQSGLPSHIHAVGLNDPGVANPPYGAYKVGVSGSTFDTGSTGGTAASQAHNHGATGSGGSSTQAVMNPYTATSFIIKY